MEQPTVRHGLQMRTGNTVNSMRNDKTMKKPVMAAKKGFSSTGLENVDPSSTKASKPSVKKERKGSITASTAVSTLFYIYEDPQHQTTVAKKSEDKSPKILNCEIGIQTDEDRSVQNALDDLLCSDDAPDGYWRDLAEQRGEALRETLEENEQLYMKMEKLKMENYRLKMIAEQAEYFADMYQRLKAAVSDNEAEADTTTEEPL